MPRQAGIWFRKSDRFWYTTHGRKAVRLGKDHASAVTAFHRLKCGVADHDDGLAIRDVCNLRLAFIRSNREPRTYRDAHRTLGMFVAAMPAGMLAGDLRPHHLSAWVDRPDWGPTYRHMLLSGVQQAFRQVSRRLIPTQTTRGNRPRPVRCR